MSLIKNNTPNEHTDSLSLAPKGFFEKKMNISQEALCNLFVCWKDAITNFLNGNFKAHDALVGENACHIRAFAILDIALLNDDNIHFNSMLITIVAELKRIIYAIETSSLTNEDIKNSVQNFLNKHNLIFAIPTVFIHHLKYIIDTYLLTLTKEQLPTSGLTLRERTNYQPVRDWGFAYNRAQYLVHNTQKSLSAASCAHVISQGKILKNKGLSLLLEIKKDAHERSFIPQFFTAKVLFLRALEQSHPLLIKITRYFNQTPLDTNIFCFKPNDDKNDFELFSGAWDNKPCIIIEGVVNYSDMPESMEEYKSRLVSQPILTTILANFAIHPQYSGELKHLPPPFEEIISSLENPSNENNSYNNKKPDSYLLKNTINAVLAEQKEFHEHMQFAIEKGCSLKVPTLLFINHMYCDTTDNYLDYFDSNCGHILKHHEPLADDIHKLST